LDCEAIRHAAYDIDDGTGTTKSRLVIWNKPGHDVSGIIARSEKIVKTTEKLLGGEVFHYHTKLIPKQPKTGGVFQWHQDYGYWYNNGNLKPDLNTVYIAVDRCDTGNGCIEIMPGSHKCGRLDHGPIGGQQGANLERMELLKQKFPTIPVVMDAGDTMIFHANIVHKSNANNSDRRRWALLISYNTKENESAVKHHHASYEKLDVVPDSAILECTNFNDMTGKDFIDAASDKTVGKPEFVEDVEKQ